jgi:hypothetical protein
MTIIVDLTQVSQPETPVPDPGEPYPVPDPGKPYPVPDPRRSGRVFARTRRSSYRRATDA